MAGIPPDSLTVPADDDGGGRAGLNINIDERQLYLHALAVIVFFKGDFYKFRLFGLSDDCRKKLFQHNKTLYSRIFP